MDIIKCPYCHTETEIGGLVGQGTNQCPKCGNPVITRLFSQIQVGTVFIDVQFGGEWTKISDAEATCVEDDSAYRVGESAPFLGSEQVRPY